MREERGKRARRRSDGREENQRERGEAREMKKGRTKVMTRSV